MSTPNTLSIEQVAQSFAAMGSEARLSVLLTLVKAGQFGLAVGEIQKLTGMTASTLAHHLRFLVSAELVAQEKQGRTVINRAAYPHLALLAEYILKECCIDENKPCSEPDNENCCQETAEATADEVQS